ncbi:hypothetical protein EGW08_022967 [Elysia chlorotica]|uniref:RNase H type-1 domain-containing protein n=1 Tax=Elysia chlorotica TaxID=188477 RepID=A0A433SJJ3_ELYCH|nr:hypothetical protein EGW08_022967 [Elysia chlorotica]
MPQPFWAPLLSKALKGIVGEHKSVTKLRSSELLVECCSEAQVKRLGKIDTFDNIPVTVKAPGILHRLSSLKQRNLNLHLELDYKTTWKKIETKYENIDNVKVRKPPPWEQYSVKFDTSLTEFEKGNTNALVLQKEFLNLKEQCNEYYEIYTDGSKQDHKVAAAFFLPADPGDSDSARLRDRSSVFSAELEAILMAIKMRLACILIHVYQFTVKRLP